MSFKSFASHLSSQGTASRGRAGCSLSSNGDDDAVLGTASLISQGPEKGTVIQASEAEVPRPFCTELSFRFPVPEIEIGGQII